MHFLREEPPFPSRPLEVSTLEWPVPECWQPIMKLSVIMPIYNERATLQEVVGKVLSGLRVAWRVSCASPNPEITAMLSGATPRLLSGSVPNDAPFEIAFWAFNRAVKIGWVHAV